MLSCCLLLVERFVVEGRCCKLVQHVQARNQHSASGGKKSSSKERCQLLIQFDGHGGKIDHSIADLSAATENRRDG